MNLKTKGYCFGFVLICTIAIATFDTGVCEPVEFTTRPLEHGPENDKRSVLTAAMPPAYRQTSPPRLRKPVKHRGGASTPGSVSPGMDHYQNNPLFKTICNKGSVTRIVRGRFEFTVAGSISSDTQAEEGGNLQPLVECADGSMILTVPRKWAGLLRIGSGSGFSFPLSKVPPRCKYSTNKSWRDISFGIQYNGCNVMQEGQRYVLPLIWRRTPVRISCPVSPMSPQALGGLSLCCSSFDLTITIQGLAAEPNVKVRGEWTPLHELVQHCGYALDRRTTETVITTPYFACGITSKDGNRSLSLRVGEDLFLLTCFASATEAPRLQGLQPATSTKASPGTLRSFKSAPPFYLVPPHFPHPTRRRKTHVHSNTPLTPSRTSFETHQVKAPQQNGQQHDHARPPEEHYRQWDFPAQGFPHLKHGSIPTPAPTHATGSSPSLLPPNYAFNPYYHFYHHPKIPQTNWPPDSVMKSQQQSEINDKISMFYSNLAHNAPQLNAAIPRDSFFHHVSRTNMGDFWSPARPAHAGLIPTVAAQIYGGYTPETPAWGVKDFYRDTVTPSIKHTPFSPPSPPPHVSQPNLNAPIFPYHHLPHDLFQMYYLNRRPQEVNVPTPAFFPFPQEPTNSNPPSEDPKHGFGSYFQPEVPVKFKPDYDPAGGLNNEGESAAHLDSAYDGSSWEKWLNVAAQVNDGPESQYSLPPRFPLPEEFTQATMQDHISASSMAQPSASPCCPGTGSRFHRSVSPGCSTFPVKECIVGTDFVFSLPEFVVEPRVVSPSHSESCAIRHLTSNPNVYFVPLHGCGVTHQVIDTITIYHLEFEACDFDKSLRRMMVECISSPGFPSTEMLFILDLPPLQDTVPLQLRIATDEAPHYLPEAHLPLSRLRGRLVFMELSLLQPPDPSVVLRIHYCLAYTLSPDASAMLIYDGCLSGSELQRLPSLSPFSQYIVVTSFLSLTSSGAAVVSDVDPEVYFFCSTEVCSASDTACSTGCNQSS